MVDSGVCYGFNENRVKKFGRKKIGLSHTDFGRNTQTHTDTHNVRRHFAQLIYVKVVLHRKGKPGEIEAEGKETVMHSLVASHLPGWLSDKYHSVFAFLFIKDYLPYYPDILYR